MLVLARRTLSSAACLVITLLLIAARPALADSYTVGVVLMTQSENFYGIDSNGDFVVNGRCGVDEDLCYVTYYIGQSTPVVYTSPPALQYDDGSKCTPIVSSNMFPLNAVCNNGHEIFNGEYDPNFPSSNGAIQGVWTGPNPTTDYLESGSFDGGFINSRGDAVFINGRHDTLDFAFDLTTASVPEPSSPILVSTGCLLFLLVTRLKMIRRPRF